MDRKYKKGTAPTNFLTTANKDFFIPKGLYAMVVIYKTSGSEQPEVGIERVDLGATAVAKCGGDAQPDTTVTESGGSEKPKMLEDVKEKMKQLRIASGETHGEAEMPVTCASLIFPGLDAAAVASSHANEERKGEGTSRSIKAKSKSASKFVNDYYDRRAQASYVCSSQPAITSLSFSRTSSHLLSLYGYILETSDEPVTGLSKPRFHPDRSSSSRSAKIPIAFCRPQQRNQHALLHADHRRQVQSRAGSPRSHLPLFSKYPSHLSSTNGKISRLGARRRAQREAAEKRAQGIREQSSKRLLQENVLYLMVVNMPSQEELSKAKRDMQAAKEKRAAGRRQRS